MDLRPLTTIDDFKRVVELECEIWGYTDAADAVGVPILIVSVKRGGILLGAFDGGRMVGFVYSLPGLKQGRPMQWSHMLGVIAPYRGAGVGLALKLEQRRLTIGMGLDLIEWTYDPLQAVNAHLNFGRLGVVVDEYALNVYGDSTSPLHQGTPTDRFIAQWWLRAARVERTLGLAAAPAAGEPGAGTDGPAPLVNATVAAGDWVECARVELGRSDPSLRVAIPIGFTEMQLQAPGLAQAWRLATREVFAHYLGRGYSVVAFSLDEPRRFGTYRLAARAPAAA